MEFTVDSKLFKDALKNVVSFLEEETRDVSLTAKKGALVIEGGHGGAYAKQEIEAEVHKKGEPCCVDAGAILNLRLTTKVSTFSIESNAINVKSGSFSGTLNAVLPVERIQKIKPKKLVDLTHEFSSPAFKNGLTFLSISPILAQPDDSNVKIVIKKKKLFMMTNDDYRGVYYSTPFKAEPLECMISSKKLTNIMGFVSGKIHFGVTSKKVRFKDESGFDCQCPLIQGKTDVKDVVAHIDNLLEGTPDFSFTANPKHFYDSAANISSIYKSEDGSTIVASVDKKKKLMVVSMKAHTGKAKDVVKLLSVKPKKDFELHTTDKLLLDALKLLANNVPESCEVRIFGNLMVLLGENEYKVRYLMPLVQND